MLLTPLSNAQRYGAGAFFGTLALIAVFAVGARGPAANALLPHGVCYLWDPNLIRLHALSDALIGLAYVAIPLTLVHFVRKRTDLPFNWMFVLFGLFIVACGATHWMEVLTLWRPEYWIAGTVKAVTAAASVPTAILLYLLLPAALAVPSTRQLQEAKDALQEARDNLERRVAERTRELQAANAELERQREALRAEDRRKSEFIAILSHELRNPVHAIDMSAAWLKATARGADEARALDSISRQVRKLGRLMNDMLDASRLSGPLELRREPVDVRRVVQAALETVRGDLEERGHRVELELPSEPALADADPQRLEQALANLIQNAAKYTDAGGRVCIRTRMEDNEVCTVVEDTGIGMDEADRARLYQLFSQGERARSRAAGGLGIGLHVAKAIAEAHGGRIDAASEGRGRGSRFTLCLPPASAARAARVDPPRVPLAASGALRILVVDDNRDAADTLAQLLALNGHGASAAYSAAQALRAAEERRPQAVLLDIGLPDASGHDVARAIRRLPWGRDVLLVALTGWGAEDDRRRALESGFDHHLTKPVDHDKLAALLVQAAARG